MNYRNNKRDGNEKQIVEIYNALGAETIEMPPRSGYDRTVLFGGKAHIVEIKTPEQYERKNHGLTLNEGKMKEKCERMGVTYHIVFDEKSAAAVIGRVFL